MAEPLDATFFAFKKREQGGVLLRASLTAFALFLVVAAVFAGAAWTLLGGSDFLQWYGSVMTAAANGETSAAAPPNLGGMFLMIPLYFFFLFTVFVVFAAYESTALRWMIRGERSGFLHFGADMWRVYGTYWAWFLFFVLTGILFWVLMFVIAAATSAALGETGVGLTGIIMLLVCLAWIVGWIYVATRLAPAAATSVAIGRFAPMKAWSASRERFWPLFGAFVLITILYIIVAMTLGLLVSGSMYMGVFSQLDWSLATTDPVAFNQAYEQAMMSAMMAQFSNPVSLALYVGGQLLMYAVAMVFYLLYFGVNARAAQAALEEGKIEPEAA